MADAADDHSYNSSENRVWSDYLNKVGRGNPAALASLYDETSGLVYSVARRILCNAADAEEITLDVYHYVWRAADTYDPSRSSITAWLVMLTRSRAIDRLRKSKSAAGKCNLESLTAPPLFHPSAVADNDRRILVRRALQQLSAEQRDLLELSFFLGLSHQEMSSRLNIPLGTIKTRIRMSLLRLGVLLRDPQCPG